MINLHSLFLWDRAYTGTWWTEWDLALSMPEKHRFTAHSTDLQSLLPLQDLERPEGAEMQTEAKRREAEEESPWQHEEAQPSRISFKDKEKGWIINTVQFSWDLEHNASLITSFHHSHSKHFWNPKERICLLLLLWRAW